MRQPNVVFLLALLTAGLAGFTQAFETSTTNVAAKTARTGRAAEDSAPITEEREEAALKFAELHHDELFSLLQTLRKTNNRYYQAGLRELSRETERLARISERDPERYRLSVEIWKLDSRLRLEVARLSMAAVEEIDSRLLPLLEARQAARIELLELDAARARERLKRFDEQLETARDAERINQELERLRRTILAKNKTRLSQPQPSAKSRPATKP